MAASNSRGKGISTEAQAYPSLISKIHPPNPDPSPNSNTFSNGNEGMGNKLGSLRVISNKRVEGGSDSTNKTSPRGASRPAECEQYGGEAQQPFSVVKARGRKEVSPEAASFRNSGAWKDFEVWEIPNLLSPEQCQTLINSGNGRFRRSRIQNSKAGGSAVSNYRTSSTAWMDPDKEPEEIKSILKRVRAVGTAVTGMDDFVAKASREVQLVQYEIGQQYQAHYDGRMLANGVLEGRGTLLVYLNEGFTGGETHFPNIDLKVVPETGKGVLWYTHITPDGVEDVRSKHAGLMVQEGTKYLCTQWFGLPD